MMKSREFKKIYHPRMEKYVYKHRGNGLIVDTLMKPIKSISSAILRNVAKPCAKKAIKAAKEGVCQASERVGKKVADKAIEKSGKLLSKHLSQMRSKGSKGSKGSKVTKDTVKNTRDDVNMLINNLIARS